MTEAFDLRSDSVHLDCQRPTFIIYLFIIGLSVIRTARTTLSYFMLFLLQLYISCVFIIFIAKFFSCIY